MTVENKDMEKLLSSEFKDMPEWVKNSIRNYDKVKKANDDALSIMYNPNARNTKRMQTYGIDKLQDYMQNPYANVKNLRNLSRYLFFRTRIYQRLIYYNANMIDLNYREVIPNIDFTKEINNEQILKSYYDTLNLLKNVNLDIAFEPAIVTVFREDVYFGCAFLEDDGLYIIPLDPDYCKVTGLYADGSLSFCMDMAYFDKNAEQLEALGEPFVSMYREYERDKQGNKWQLMPDENSVCLKFDRTDFENPIPPFIGMFDSFVNLEDLKSIAGVQDEQDIYKLLVAELPTNNTTNIDDFKIDPKTAVTYLNRILQDLPDYFGAILSPMPIKEVNINQDKALRVNKIEEATKAAFNSAGGAQVLNGSTISGTTAWKGAIASDEDMAMSSLLPQIEGIVNRIISFKLKNASKIKFLPISTYSVEDARNNVMKACTYGTPNKLLLGTLNGHTELETLSMLYLENDILDLSTKYIPLQSSNTQNTGDIGRPTKKEKGEPISDDGEASQDKRDRAK